MTNIPEIKRLIRSKVKTEIEGGLMMINKNQDSQFIIKLYLTIWNMCYEKELDEIGVEEVYLMNIQEFPDLIPKEIKPINDVEELCLGEYPNLKLFPKILEFKKLKRLELGGNNINRFPKEFKELKNLEDLWFVDDNIEEIPNEIGELKRLKKLSLSTCKLRGLNDSMAKLKNLEELDLSHNELTSLPNWIFNLPKLRKLNLYDTGIRKENIPNKMSQKMKILI